MKIHTEPSHAGGFTAYDIDTYDCDCDQDGFFSDSPVGWGKTEVDAVENFLELLPSTQATQADLLQNDLKELLEILGMPSSAQARSPHEVFQDALAVLKTRIAEPARAS